MSAGTPPRRTGIAAATARASSSMVVPIRSAVALVIAVSMKPGAIALAVIAERAELDGQRLGQALQPRLGRRVVRLAAVAERRRRRHRDDPAVLRCDHVLLRDLAARKAPRRCTSMTVVQSSSVILNSRLSRSHAGVVDQDVQPAELARRARRRPPAPGRAWTRRRRAPRAAPPAALISSATAAAASRLRSSTPTLAPPAASCRAISAPMPCAAPVTSATRPCTPAIDSPLSQYLQVSVSTSRRTPASQRSGSDAFCAQ